jgi:hypothetical protein
MAGKIRLYQCAVLRHSGWTLSRLALQRITAAVNAIPPNPALLQINATDLFPSINQKGVDMRIGLDIAWIALKKVAETNGIGNRGL